jgi:hypothetical protein
MGSRSFARSGIRFCGDQMLRYASVRRAFRPGETLTFDRAYRIAQLPLVSPGHPEAIEQAQGHEYLNGYYSARRVSLA